MLNRRNIKNAFKTIGLGIAVATIIPALIITAIRHHRIEPEMRPSLFMRHSKRPQYNNKPNQETSYQGY